MKRMFRYIALLLGSVGLVGCVAGLVSVWMLRGDVLQGSDELCDVVDDGLQLVEQKLTRAVDLVGQVQSGVDSIPDELREFAADRAARGDSTRERIGDKLFNQFERLDEIAEAGATAIAFLDKIDRLNAVLRAAAARRTGDESADALQPRFPELARVVSRLTDLREILDKIRAGRPVVREIVDAVAQATRGIEQDLERVDSKLQQLQQNSSQWRNAIEEARTKAIPRWINVTAVVASALAAWMGLGQFALLRSARRSIHGAQRP